VAGAHATTAAIGRSPRTPRVWGGSDDAARNVTCRCCRLSLAPRTSPDLLQGRGWLSVSRPEAARRQDRGDRGRQYETGPRSCAGVGNLTNRCCGVGSRRTEHSRRHERAPGSRCRNRNAQALSMNLPGCRCREVSMVGRHLGLARIGGQAAEIGRRGQAARGRASGDERKSWRKSLWSREEGKKRSRHDRTSRRNFARGAEETGAGRCCLRPADVGRARVIRPHQNSTTNTVADRTTEKQSAGPKSRCGLERAAT